jgi:hypothetical protein
MPVSYANLLWIESNSGTFLPFFVLFLVILGFELRAWCFLGRVPTLDLCCLPFLLWVNLGIGSHFMPGLDRTAILLFMFSHGAGNDRCTPLCPAIG